jgi:transposase
VNATCKLLNINRTSIWRWKKSITIKKRKSHATKMFGKFKDAITNFLHRNPCASQYKLRQLIPDLTLSKNTLSKYIKLLNFTRKRTQRRGVCKNKALEQLTDTFIKRYKYFGKENIICVDECGVSENLRPSYGYSKQGVPLIINTPGGWTHYSLLLAIFPYGRVEYFITQGSINKQMFETFIDGLDLDSNEVILMDNASIHKNLTLQNEGNIIYTPPYSPQYNAIELCFSQVKNIFKHKFIFQKNEIVNTIIDSIFEGLNHDKIINCYEHVDKLVNKLI